VRREHPVHHEKRDRRVMELSARRIYFFGALGIDGRHTRESPATAR
jgi:hypothetical protein